jgi:hypothetical protein
MTGYPISDLADVLADLETMEHPDDLDALIDVWDALDIAHRVLGVIARDYSTAIADRLDGQEYTHQRVGPLHPEQSRREQWRGHDLIAVLAQPVADTDTGQVIDAVPVDTLRAVLPACATDRETSSRWKVSGLRDRGVDVDRYRAVEYGTPVLRRGVKR